MRALCGGAGVGEDVLLPLGGGTEGASEWAERGASAFGGRDGAGAEARREVVEGIVGGVGAPAELPGWCDDEVRAELHGGR